MSRGVAITGMGIISAIGNNVEENYEWMSSELFEAICDIWHDEHQDSERERALYR